MKKTLLALALILPSALAAQDFVVVAGKQGGGYDKKAQEIAQRLTQRGIKAVVENANGSDEITLALCGGTGSLGITQIDAIYARAKDGCDLKPVGVYGEEIAVLMFPPKSENDELSDLGESDTIMVDAVGSGTELFWRTIVSTENGEDGSGDGWAKAQPSNDPLEMAHTAATFGDVSAVLLVRKASSADILRLLELDWTVGEMWDKDIDDLIYKKAPLYESKEVPFAGYSQWVYAVRSFMVVPPVVANGDRKTFAAITAAVQ